MNHTKISFQVTIDVNNEQTLQQIIEDYNDNHQTNFCIINQYVHSDGLCFCAIEIDKNNEPHIFELGYRLAKAQYQTF